jgi:hypothetical protein
VWFRRRDPTPAPVKPEEPKGVLVWTAADYLQAKQPATTEVVTDLGGGQKLHTFTSAQPTDVDRERAEWAALAASNRALSPGSRPPVSARRPSIFDRPADPDRFPS